MLFDQQCSLMRILREDPETLILIYTTRQTLQGMS